MAARRRDAPIGGQAVLEGVMMRGIRTWSVAVRSPTPEQLQSDRREIPTGPITVQTFPFSSALRRHRVLRLPIVRGVVALGGSLAMGLRALNISANAQIGPSVEDGEEGAEALSGATWVLALVVSFAFAIGLFFLVPVGLVSLIKSQLHSSTLFWLIEGVVRTAIFLGYLLVLSRMRDLRRVFEYHGAEHKTIACHEAGQELTPESLVEMLNHIFSAFDDLAERHHLEKIKTIGDAYMAVAGLPEPRADHAQLIADLALDMLTVVQRFTDDTGAPMTIRVGISSGMVVAGVIGKSKFVYDLWGDPVNTAGRMESYGLPGRIQVSEATKHLLEKSHRLDSREEPLRTLAAQLGRARVVLPFPAPAGRAPQPEEPGSGT